MPWHGRFVGADGGEDYVDKLPTLYGEFAEATRFTKNKTHFIAMFSSAEDLLRKTPAFWQNYVQLKLTRDFGGLHKFLSDPIPTGRIGILNASRQTWGESGSGSRPWKHRRSPPGRQKSLYADSRFKPIAPFRLEVSFSFFAGPFAL